jgi:hypothetical protein
LGEDKREEASQPASQPRGHFEKKTPPCGSLPIRHGESGIGSEIDVFSARGCRRHLDKQAVRSAIKDQKVLLIGGVSQFFFNYNEGGVNQHVCTLKVPAARVINSSYAARVFMEAVL